jgi:hypothetical protein
VLSAQKADHYISRAGMKMRSGQYAASLRTLIREEGETAGGKHPQPIMRGTARLAWMCVQGDLKDATRG